MLDFLLLCDDDRFGWFRLLARRRVPLLQEVRGQSLHIVQTELADAFLQFHQQRLRQLLRLVFGVESLEQLLHGLAQRLRFLDDQGQFASGLEGRRVRSERFIVDQRSADAQQLLVGDGNVRQGLLDLCL